MGLIDPNNYESEKTKVDLGRGEFCFVRELTEGEVEKAFAEHTKDANSVALVARLTLAGACNEQGEPIFKNLEQVKNAPYRWADKIGSAVLDMNKGTIEEIEDAAKN